ncbi:uncharacterized protein LOC116714162 isoform X2 [Xiphophorus hellerii]|uniref:uncharacterized protein LOC116714162 isoform X2 n=1 Tax=Xiphophorus hellerii TaxID=8084 RepID=UPI0013B468E8|nr:uncharacterized protein LOC116714162 isoform X2 [Xiphophorus hellerii]
MQPDISDSFCHFALSFCLEAPENPDGHIRSRLVSECIMGFGRCIEMQRHMSNGSAADPISAGRSRTDNQPNPELSHSQAVETVHTTCSCCTRSMQERPERRRQTGIHELQSREDASDAAAPSIAALQAQADPPDGAVWR